MPGAGRLLTGTLVMAAGVGLAADQRIATPFELVPVWSEEMVRYLAGATQPACSGASAGACERLNTGTCDGAAYFTLPPHDREHTVPAPLRPAKQTDSAAPQYFGVAIANAGYGGQIYQLADPGFQSIDVVFDCQHSGNELCSASRLHVGAVRTVEIALASGEKTVDLTHAATVRDEGMVAVATNRAAMQSLFADPRALYKVRVVTECFAVRPSAREWTFPVREAPAADARPVGSIVARILPGSGMDLVFRPNEGADVPFDTDWVENDTGYTYLRDQTVLDRHGDWYLLPQRPFPRPVWIHLPGREERARVEADTVYELAQKVTARVRGTSRRVTFPAGNILVVAVRGRMLEIRKEESFDGPCTDPREQRAKARGLRTYLVAAEAFYDRDRHLRLKPAYTRGC